MDHDLLVALQALADPNRLRVAGACAAAPRTIPELADELDLPEPAVRRHVARLEVAGLIEPTATASTAAAPEVGYRLRPAAIHAVGRRLATIQASDAPVSGPVGPGGEPLPADEAKVISGYFRDDRLTTLPSQEKRRLIVIRYLRDRCFADDRPYPEKEVNQRLAAFHPDVATLRRAMVDSGLMTRQAGIYRRPAPATGNGP